MRHRLDLLQVAVLVPVDKNTRMTEVKASFLEAIAPLSPEDAASSGIPDPGTLGSSGDSIRLFKDSTDDSGEPIWLPLADSATVDKAGLDQGHTVGVSFKTPGESRRRGICYHGGSNASPVLLAAN